MDPTMPALLESLGEHTANTSRHQCRMVQLGSGMLT